MTRTPIDVYRGLIQTRFGDEVTEQIPAVVSRFYDYMFADKRLSVHLTKFIGLWSRLIAYLDSRYVVGLEDLTTSIDVLDHLASTSKWWVVTRKEPGFILRPRLRDPRDFMKSIASVQISGGTANRITGSVEKLFRFLEEHKIAERALCEDLCSTMVSTWSLLSAFAGRSQGRNATNEQDFEVAYDTVRVLLFYIHQDDFKALSASRKIATSPRLPMAAGIGFSPGFERKLENSVAARLEETHEDFLTQITSSTPSASRSILTNSLRLLAQIQAASVGLDRIEEEDYDEIIIGAMKLLERVGISSDSFSSEKAVEDLFKKLRPEENVDKKIGFLARRLEGFIVDSTGSRDFLLQYARLVPRLIALLLLLAGGNKPISKDGLRDIDLKRGLILLDSLLND
ncbi:MAG: hypothetical protein ACXADL_11580 [Candidatus Thorarchaeota archaeon]|jgi:hypothetical protein